MTMAPLIAYYGDDFTGSTDVMEALSSNGVETVLFTELPDDAMRRRFDHCRGVGLAGKSRSQGLDWMDRELPAIFRWLRDSGAAVSHYKLCSTFDSAPHLGSIGRAMEIGLREFAQSTTAILVGAPQLRRYTAFATLFAGYAGETYRIDRHPVMSVHPATPMDEADLRLHLARQTDTRIGLVDLHALLEGTAEQRLDTILGERPGAVFIDVADKLSQRRAGDLLWRNLHRVGALLFGSSGIEYALLEPWREEQLLAPAPPSEPLAPRDRIAVVSGSCSATTDIQIHTAEKAGFRGIGVDYRALATGEGLAAATEQATYAASTALQAGESPILFTARGAGARVELPARSREAADERVGVALGTMLDLLRREHGLDRVIIAGGDTSSHGLRQLNVRALTLRHPLTDTPGSPVCEAHFASPDAQRLEIMLKGGQVGSPDLFERIRSGRIAA